MKYQIVHTDIHLHRHEIEYIAQVVHVRFKRFTYGFLLESNCVGNRLLQNLAEREAFLGTLVETLIVPNIDSWGRLDQWFRLEHRAGHGFVFSIAECPDLSWMQPHEEREVEPRQVLAFFHYPPMWVGSNPWEDNVLSKNSLEEVVVHERLPKTRLEYCVSRDGEFWFDFSQFPATCLPSRKWGNLERRDHSNHVKWDRPKKDLRINVLNCFLGLLYARQRKYGAASFHMWLTSSYLRNAHTILGPAGGLSRASRGGGARKLPNFTEPKYVLDSEVMERNVFPPFKVEAIREAATLLDSLLTKEDDRRLFREVLLWHKARIALDTGDYDETLRLSWFVIEGILHQVWLTYLDTHRRQLNDDRKNSLEFMPKERLQSLSRFKMEQVVEFLSLAGELPDHFYRETNKIRALRNSNVHTLAVTEPDMAQLALGLCELYIDHYKGLWLRSGARPYLDAVKWEEWRTELELTTPSDDTIRKV